MTISNRKAFSIAVQFVVNSDIKMYERQYDMADAFTARRFNGIAEFAGLEFAGVENDGRSRRGGICKTGK